jgi:hypothetical protein
MRHCFIAGLFGGGEFGQGRVDINRFFGRKGVNVARDVQIVFIFRDFGGFDNAGVFG